MINGKCACGYEGGSANYEGFLTPEALSDKECPACHKKEMVEIPLSMPKEPLPHTWKDVKK